MFQLRDYQELTEQDKKKYKEDSLLLYILSVIFISGGITFLILDILNTQLSINHLITELKELINILLWLLVPFGLLLTFYSENNYNYLIEKTIWKFPKNKEKSITNVRVSGIIILLFSLFYILYFK
jgi:hypothetical protein